MTLQMLTYLAPSVPIELFECLRAHLEVQLGTDVALSSDSSRSGPRPGEPEPFSSGEADLAFVCATSYVWLTGPGPAVELVGAAWIPDDTRILGRPRYLADVLTRHRDIRTLADIAGTTVGYNDEASLSGRHSLEFALRNAAIDPRTVKMVRTGSHLRSLEMLARADIDVAAIDSTVWHRVRRDNPGAHGALHSITALGPHPTQPAVVRRGLAPTVTASIRRALLDAHTVGSVHTALQHAGLRAFAPVSDTDFGALRTQLASSAP